jgi:hypothetical protein
MNKKYWKLQRHRIVEINLNQFELVLFFRVSENTRLTKIVAVIKSEMKNPKAVLAVLFTNGSLWKY